MQSYIPNKEIAATVAALGPIVSLQNSDMFLADEFLFSAINII